MTPHDRLKKSISKSTVFALILVVIGCLLVIHTFLLLNDFLCCRFTLLSDYARYSKQFLPVILSGLAAALFLGFGFLFICRDKRK